MKFPSIFKFTDTTPPSAAASSTSAWAWPSCANSPRTLSFRDCKTSNMLKTSNSAFLAAAEPSFDDGADLRSTENPFDDCDSTGEIAAAGLLLTSSDRLIFEPGQTNSFLEEAKAPSSSGGRLKPPPAVEEEGVSVVAMDSFDPFLDFRVSMEEMIVAHGLYDWECLEDLLTCYLKVNVKSNHGYIIGAFMDLLVNLSLANCNEEEEDDEEEEQCGNNYSSHGRRRLLLGEGSFTSPLSFCSSSCSFNSPSSAMEVSEGHHPLLPHVSECNNNSCSSSSSSRE